MDWNVIQQLIRITLYNAGALFLGKSVADGDLYQAAIGGVISILAFGWWIYQQRKGKGTPPFVPILALLVVLPLLGGCVSVQDALARAMTFMGQVRTTLVEVREGIRAGCNAIGIAEQEAATVNPACQQKVSKLKASVTAICQNQALLTDDVVGNYFSSVANAVKQAQAACK